MGGEAPPEAGRCGWLSGRETRVRWETETAEAHARFVRAAKLPGEGAPPLSARNKDGSCPEGRMGGLGLRLIQAPVCGGYR